MTLQSVDDVNEVFRKYKVTNVVHRRNMPAILIELINELSGGSPSAKAGGGSVVTIRAAEAVDSRPMIISNQVNSIPSTSKSVVSYDFVVRETVTQIHGI